MLKKLMMFALMALVAAVFVGPASASAAEFTHEGSPIAEEAEYTTEYSGTLGFKTPLGSFSCTVDISATFTSGGTASVKKFQITTSTCKGTGALATCELASDEATVPFAAHATESGTVDIEGIVIHNTYTNCSVPPSTITFAHATATPSNGFTSLTITGSGAVDIPGIGTVPAEAEGTVSGEMPENTIGIE